MKLSTAVIVLSSIASSAALTPSAKLLKAARRLEDAAAQEEQAEYAFLQGYSLKMIQCKKDETYVSPVDGSYEYSSVVFRLCPNECDNDAKYGCSSGYGDYVVGLNTFAQAYLEEKRDDMQGDDDVNDWKFEKFGVCQEWEVDKDAEVELAEGEALYVGPECTEDSLGVKLAMFSDALCETESEAYTFEEISNGVSLPYSSGGLIGTGCESCYGQNDRGEYEISEMCTGLFEVAGKCESAMESFHSAGKNEESCEVIAALMPASSKSGAGGAIGWTIFALAVVGAAAYGFMTYKKKQDEKRQGLMS